MLSPVKTVLVFTLGAIGACGPANALNVYRCVAADGATSYQDRPCARGETQTIVPLADYAPSPESAVAAPMMDATPDPAAAVATTPAAPRSAPPSFFLCLRFDGSWYQSADGIGSTRLVPYGMLAGSGQTLAQAFGGKNGIGVSAPGLREPPTVPFAQAPIAGSYVSVQDQCHQAGPREACAYLRDQLDGVEDKLKRAFSDTEPQLKREQDALRDRLRGC